MAEKQNSGVVLEVVTFVCGALVMIYEITGSRLLAPHLGTSTYIWTSLIGVILASLSVGYWTGGKIADRKPEIKVLSVVLLLAAILMTLTILFKDLLLTTIVRFPLSLEIKAVIAAVALFAPVSVLFGFVSPYAIRLRISALENAGKTVGRLYALSTLGSILGTFAAGFFLVPFVGSTRILYLIAATLLVLSLLLAPFSFRATKLGALILMLLVAGSIEFATYVWRIRHDFYDVDTEYNRVQIFGSVDKKTNRPIRLMMNDPYFAQSVMYLDKDELFPSYTNYYHLIRYFRPDFKNTLIIGGAGYSFPKDYLKAYSAAQIEVVEIDRGVTALARAHFNLRDHSNLKITHADGRIFLNRADRAKYDVVLIDAFGSLFSVPFQLTTLEAVKEMNRVLTDDGVVMVNLVSAFEGDKAKFLAAERKTFAEVFPSVRVFKVDGEAPDDEAQNIILVASKSEKVLETAVAPEIAEMLANEHSIEKLPSNVVVLTDELAPVEYYNSFAQNFR